MSWDGLRGCENCGNDTTGRFCPSCLRQHMIDNDPNPPRVPTLWCELCGVPIDGNPSGQHIIDVCPTCGDETRQMYEGRDNWGENIHIHPYITD